MANALAKAALPALLASSLLTGCVSTSSTGNAPLNQRTWPWCSVLGGLVGGGIGATESAAVAGGGAAVGAILGGLICYAQDGDQDDDGVFDRRDRCPDTPEGSAVYHNGCPLKEYPVAAPAQPPVQDEVIVLSGDVLFGFDSAQLTPAAISALDALVARLSSADVRALSVTGHTDSVGNDLYNQQLSERRASSVADYLISRGVPSDKLSTSGSGESRPVAENDSEEGRARNRRVEIAVDR